MLLMDRIARECRINPCPKYIENVAPVLRGASKFVLSESFATAADALTIDQIEKIRPFIRVPFQTTWIEVAHQHRPGFVNSKTPLGSNERQPERIGILFEAATDEMNHFAMSMFFSFPERLISQAPFHVATTCYGVIFAAEKSKISKYRSKLATAFGFDPIKAAATTPDDHVDLMPNAYFMDDAGAITDEGLRNRALETSMGDWQGEPSFWLGALGLLNCKNAVEITEIDNKEVNRKRARIGRPPLTNHHVCNITLGKTRDEERREATNAEEERQMIRAHFVRGHFKVRKTGIYWWSPYVRGDLAQGFVSKDYRVQKLAV